MRVGLDIDGVLADQHKPLAQRIKARGLPKRTWYDYAVEKVYPELPDGFCHNLYNDSSFVAKMPVVKGAREGARLLSDLGEIYYVSARPAHLLDVTIEWLCEHDFPVGDVWLSEDKAEAVQMFGLELFVEDAPHHALALAQVCPVYLLDYPWNRDCHHSNIWRVRDWGELYRRLEESALL